MSWLARAKKLISPTALGLYVTGAFAWTTIHYYTAIDGAFDQAGVINQLLITAHQKSIDFRLKTRGERPGAPNIGLLTIDEKAVSTIGRWPWPREVIGRAIDNAISYGAKILAFDIVFSEASNQPAAEILKELETKEPLPERIKARFTEATIRHDSDRALGETFAKNHDHLVLGAIGGGGLPTENPEFDYCIDQLFSLTPEYDTWVNREQSSLISLTKGPELPSVLGDFYKEHLRTIAATVAEGKSQRTSLEKYNLRTKILEKQITYCTSFLNPATDETYSAIAENWPQVAGAIDSELIKKFPTFDAWVEDFKTHGERSAIPQVIDWTMNLPSLLHPDKSYNTGYFNAQLDPDGTIRRSRLLMRTGHTVMPSLALKAFLLSNNYNAQISYRYSARTNKHLIDKLEIINDEGTPVFEVPVDPSGRLAINYAGRQKMFPHVSMADLLSDNDSLTYEVREPSADKTRWREVTKSAKKAEFLKDKVLIVGATAIGIYDLRVTPFEENYPGAETHVNVLDNLIRRDFLRSHPSEETYMLAAILVIGIILSVALAHLGALPGLSLVGSLFIGIALIDRFYIFGQGTVVTIVLPLTLILVQFFVLISYKYLTEERRKKELRQTFSKYVSPAIVEEILSDPSKIELGGRKARVTVFFSDVRGFTTISEKLDPGALSDLLNEYLTPMTDLVFSNRGTLDKYMGDAIMAFFGAPIPHPQHAQDACRCALNQMSKLDALKRSFKEKGLPEIDIGIGLNTGEVSVGNMGSSTVRSYTVMGDAVNLASRLEGINKQYGTHIIISEFTYAEVASEFTCRELDWVRVKGKLKPVKIYELLCDGPPPDHISQWLKPYEAGYRLYHERKWSEALSHFRKVLEVRPDDGPTLLYVERCQDYLTEPPPQEWDGVFTMKSK